MFNKKATLFISLNVVRFLSILTLLLVFASSIVTMVNDIKAVQRGSTSSMVSNNATDTADFVECDYLEGSTVPNQPAGAFWAILNRLFIIFQCILLILSEVSWPTVFFQTYFPVLGPDFGVFILGTIEVLIGAAVLSHRVDMFAVVSAFFLFAVGCLNLVIGCIFRSSVKSKRSITSWRNRVPGLPRTSKDFMVVSHPTNNSIFSEKSSHTARNVSSPFTTTNANTLSNTFHNSTSPTTGAGYGFGRQGEKKAGLKGFMISRPGETLPRYAPKRSSDASSYATSHHTTLSTERAESPDAGHHVHYATDNRI